jgi:DNA-binding transcriptional LysR family regulator
MVRRGIGIGLIDNFVGEVDSALERLPGLGGLEGTLWAVTHVEMRRATRVRVVLEFLTDLVAQARMS